MATPREDPHQILMGMVDAYLVRREIEREMRLANRGEEGEDDDG